ncbi:hypothetical protein ACA097_24760 [Pseudomonas sp. QL9]|uniref:Uncharacterized protein n=1 Tax=Pseudomonas knackmussii (strain DSM 6978 / CCUG 54928 / LMG 23759 / B13) TaxID=1301098 RepID=A0A024HJ89_PSEKB|nr:hypothetical protein [Pseudomonas knackmussii]CDF84518.1 hypothetical protein PKB_3171 [Pseudomonas knackmussii B13]
MQRPPRNIRKLLDAVASHNETTALEVMRAVDQVRDELLRQRLLNAIHDLHQDAAELRSLRDEVSGAAIRLA